MFILYNILYNIIFCIDVIAMNILILFYYFIILYFI